ncbi:MAG: hypothetical protein KW802_01620 [Candidatus Doudnabacteria bacterium]|nr:hypothetical protein [Candidatus Doudnabacteria bacterium]
MNNKNISHIWSILCRHSSVDKETNNVSAFDIIEQIQLNSKEIKQFINTKVPNEIVLPLNLQLITLWGRSNNDNKIAKAEQIARVFSPTGQDLGQIIQDFEIKEKQSRFRIIVNISGFKFTGPGKYIFSIRIKNIGSDDEVEVAQIPLQIDLE